MERDPDFTVVIDTYNQGRFIERAVASVLAQERAGDVEVLVVDDGSTDDTASRLATFGDAITVVRRPNGGQAAALNTGIARARGRWIALLDGDDEWAPNHLANVRRAAEDADLGAVVWTPTVRIDEAGNELEPDPPLQVYSEILSLSWQDDSYRQGKMPWLPPTSGIAASWGVLHTIGPIPDKYRIAADGWLQMALSLLDVKFGWGDQRTVRLRVHDGNAWTGRDEHDLAMLTSRRALYHQLADDLAAMELKLKRPAPGLAQSLRMQATEFEIWEHIVSGRRSEALALAVQWEPPPWMVGQRQRTFKKLHTILATMTPVEAYTALRSAWRGSAFARILLK